MKIPEETVRALLTSEQYIEYTGMSVEVTGAKLYYIYNDDGYDACYRAHPDGTLWIYRVGEGVGWRSVTIAPKDLFS